MRYDADGAPIDPNMPESDGWVLVDPDDDGYAVWRRPTPNRRGYCGRARTPKVVDDV